MHRDDLALLPIYVSLRSEHLCTLAFNRDATLTLVNFRCDQLFLPQLSTIVPREITYILTKLCLSWPPFADVNYVNYLYNRTAIIFYRFTVRRLKRRERKTGDRNFDGCISRSK